MHFEKFQSSVISITTVAVVFIYLFFCKQNCTERRLSCAWAAQGMKKEVLKNELGCLPQSQLQVPHRRLKHTVQSPKNSDKKSTGLCRVFTFLFFITFVSYFSEHCVFFLSLMDEFQQFRLRLSIGNKNKNCEKILHLPRSWYWKKESTKKKCKSQMSILTGHFVWYPQ